MFKQLKKKIQTKLNSDKVILITYYEIGHEIKNTHGCWFELPRNKLEEISSKPGWRKIVSKKGEGSATSILFAIVIGIMWYNMQKM